MKYTRQRVLRRVVGFLSAAALVTAGGSMAFAEGGESHGSYEEYGDKSKKDSASGDQHVEQRTEGTFETIELGEAEAEGEVGAQEEAPIGGGPGEGQQQQPPQQVQQPGTQPAQPQQPQSQQQTQHQLQMQQRVQEFSQFLQEEQFEFAREGLEKLSESLLSVLPQDEQALRDRVNSFNERVDKLEDVEAADRQAREIRNAFDEAALLMVTIQNQYYPQLSQQVSQLRQSAEAIQPDQTLDMQGERISTFFQQSHQVLQQMSQAQPGSPRAGIEQPEEPIGGGPVEGEPMPQEESFEPQEGELQQPQEPGMQEEEPMGGGPATYSPQPQIRQFVDFVQQQQRLVQERPQQYATEGFDRFSRALTAVQGQPDTAITRQIQALSQRAQQLGQVPQERQAQLVRETAMQAAQLVSTIQGRSYPTLQQQARQLQQSAEQLQPDVTLEQQQARLVAFFNQASDTLQQMDRASQQGSQQQQQQQQQPQPQ